MVPVRWVSGNRQVIEYIEQGEGNIVAFVYNDGGRCNAGLPGKASDCVARAIAIATGEAYQDVCRALDSLARLERKGRRKRKVSNSQTGVHRYAKSKYLKARGWKFITTMGIGTGCRVHLRGDELPKGRLIVQVSKHLVAVIEGVINDTHDCSRDGTRCVYGYWINN